MMLDLIAMNRANQATRQLVSSARPHAPVRLDQPRRPRNRPRADRSRLLIAGVLRRLANRIEPVVVQPCQPST